MRISDIDWAIVRARCAALVAGLLLVGSGAHAADLYVAGDVGISSGIGNTDADHNLGGQSSGDSGDSSPVVGTSVGIAIPLYELFPWSMSLPRVEIPIWPGKALSMGGQEDWSFPDWDARFEFTWLGGRDYDFRTAPGPGSSDPFFTEATAHSVLARIRLDVPVQAPLNALFGRIPILDPLTIYGGGGVGVAFTEAHTTDTSVRAKEEGINLAYEIDAGLGYALTESLHWSVGWRYVNFGSTEGDLRDTVGTTIGSFDADIEAHEFTTSLRLSFWRIPFFEDRD